MNISVDIDEQLIAAMAIATQPPAIIRPFFNNPKEFDTLVEKLAADYTSSREEFTTWLSLGKKMRNQVKHVLDHNRTRITIQHIDFLRHFAQVLEKKAELGAIELRRRQKTSKRLIAKLSSVVGNSKGKLAGKIIAAAYRQWNEEIDEYLDLALIFRALAEKFNPDRTIKFVAETPEDINTYFASIN